MRLRGQLEGGEAGYAMAALLIALSVMGVLATAAMPSWKQMSQREKEAELIFRGQQYARAIGLFQRRAGPGVNPPNLDVLVQQKFLRKKYRDPITGDDFDLISPATAMSVPTAPTPGALPGTGTQPATGRTGAPGQGSGTSSARGGLSQPISTFGRGAPSGGAPVGFGGNVAGGIVGVQSKSKAESIRIYNGRTHYNEWQFVFIPQAAQPGGRGGRGQPGMPQPGVPQRGDPQRGPFRGDGRFGNPTTFPQPGGRQGSPTTPVTPQGPRGRGPFR